MRKLSKLLLKLFGWSVDISTPDYPKCIICVAPHTSNWDFILGKLAYWAVGRHAGFLMKESWFFWPLGPIFKAIGGIPVPKKRGSSLSSDIVNKFRVTKRMALAITPEGTRSRVSQWRSGFLHIAIDANIPIVLGVLDYEKKHILIDTEFKPTGDIEADLIAIKQYYSQFTAKYPDKFCTN
jgi:1-acyl-sn-glycerol-3-phosphate acyltransferase